MKNQSGAINILLFPLITAIVLLIGVASFGFWAYGERTDYKKNSDQKSAVAVAAAVKAEDAKKTLEFNEANKFPLKNYVGPDAYGSLRVSYPKDWSAYIVESSANGAVLDGYFHPDYVPDIANGTNAESLRVKIVNQNYATVLQQFSGQVQAKRVTVAPYNLPKMPDVIGSRLEGQITSDKSGSMVIIPLRDKTLQLWTEAAQYQSDFNDKILPNISFTP